MAATADEKDALAEPGGSLPARVASPVAEAPLSVLFVTGSLFDESSGPHLTLRHTARTLQQRGHRVTVVGTRSENEYGLDQWAGEAHAFRRYGPYSMHFAPGLSRWLQQNPDDWDLVSMQGVWLHPNRAAADWCLRHDKPYLISTHGNLNPAALEVSTWKKRLARHTFMAPVLRNVACYQASTEIEYRSLRNYGILEPICIIGNGIELPELDQRPAPERLVPETLQGRRTCLYLGRLHPIKGIERLLRAWGGVQPSGDWQLVVAGGGDRAYRAELETVARQSRCRNVHFTGFVPAEVKAALFRRAELFVLPSNSEAFAMAPMEAFSYGTPALITTACGFPEAAEAGAALEVPPDVDGLRTGLEQLLALSPRELQAMGAVARSFVRERYTWPIICAQLEAIYAWMCGSGPAPDCLRLD